jgi:hypothetical protein
MATLADAFADLREQALAELHLGPGTRLRDGGCGVGKRAIAVATTPNPHSLESQLFRGRRDRRRDRLERQVAAGPGSEGEREAIWQQEPA